MNKSAAFIMPVKISGNDMELRHLMLSVESVKNQTDRDWVLVMVDDFSDDIRVQNALRAIKDDLKEKVHIISLDKNIGSGMARNKGIQYAEKIGAPIILFNDSDDISDPKRLELVRKAFSDDSVNVVYTSFDIIDENNNTVPLDKVNLSVKEIIDGHKVDIVEGENAWITIAMKKKYTNLTSCTAVRTSLAVKEPFPALSVSEDSNTWYRYGAYPGKFVFLREIKGKYRICTGVQSRSRSLNGDFYKKMYEADSAGFEAAVSLAKKHGTMGGYDENDIRAAFHVRVALTLLHADSVDYCKKSLEVAEKISREKTRKYIDLLPCTPEYKAKMKSMI
ncbi:MAG: glycosyltransferase [Clostridia bacterium]|nr:glycosyltransferase [Clostridia bacterium]